MTITISAIVTFVILLAFAFHAGAGAATYRHAKNCPSGHRKPRLLACLGRGVFVWGSLPAGDGLRLGL
jgi:hypothetical protein